MSLWSTFSPVPLAWRQLLEHRTRFAVALLGVTFAVVLVLMQLGFSNALYASAVRLHQHLAADLVLISPEYSYLAISQPFTEHRLTQARRHSGVAAVAPLSFDLAPLKNPRTGRTRNLLVLGLDPTTETLTLPKLNEQLRRTHLADALLFDSASRPEYGVQPAAVRDGRRVSVELARRRIFVDGVFDLGTSFAVDGNTVTSRTTFLRLFPHRREGLIDIGLIRLHPGADSERVRAELAATLPKDVEVLTKQGFIEREQAYWRKNTPIGYVFTFGVVMGLVGAVIVADEPTASLDSVTGAEVASRIRELAKNEGCAAVVVTHDQRILRIADRVLQIEDGRLTAHNTQNPGTLIFPHLPAAA
jgi:putative ABC transport system permease protein